MAKRPISYTSRDFQGIKSDLTNYAKRYYASTYKDFNEASFGSLMLDLVAYVGDQLSFYTDYQANESFLDTAIEYGNILRLSEALGYKTPAAGSSTGTVSFYVMVPVDASTSGPDLKYIPVLERGTILGSSGGAIYTLNQQVDFSNPANETTVARVNTTTGDPERFAIKAYGQVVSGQEYVKTLTVGDYRRFLRLSLGVQNVSEIVSITDDQGNEYYEVENLTQDVVLKEQPNSNSDKGVTPYVMSLMPVPRRFMVEYGTSGTPTLQFGYGSADNITGNVIADPADVVLDVVGRDYISEPTFDPSNLIKTDKFGVVPTNTTLTVVYRSNNQDNVNSSVGGISSVISPVLSFQDESVLSQNTLTEIVQSLEVDNEEPIMGDTSVMQADEIRMRALGNYASQNRAVTRSDYVNIVYRIPPKFGKVKRANILQDHDAIRRNLNLYILGEDNGGNLIVPNSTLKENIKIWLNRYRMMNDTVDILSGRIINLGIDYEVLIDLDANKYDVLEACTEKIKEKYINVQPQMGEALYVTDIYKLLNDIPGVIDTTQVKFVNKFGGLYSDYSYDVPANMSFDGRYLTIPSDSAAEFLFPDENIHGVVK